MTRRTCEVGQNVRFMSALEDDLFVCARRSSAQHELQSYVRQAERDSALPDLHLSQWCKRYLRPYSGQKQRAFATTFRGRCLAALDANRPFAGSAGFDIPTAVNAINTRGYYLFYRVGRATVRSAKPLLQAKTRRRAIQCMTHAARHIFSVPRRRFVRRDTRYHRTQHPPIALYTRLESM
jgi:hypothetical protein